MSLSPSLVFDFPNVSVREPNTVFLGKLHGRCSDMAQKTLFKSIYYYYHYCIIAIMTIIIIYIITIVVFQIHILKYITLKH